MPTVGSGSLFMLQDIQHRDQEQVINRYFYWSSVAPNTIPATEVVTLWETKFVNQITLLQPLEYSHDITKVDELTSVANFTEQISSLGIGTLAGVALPSFVAASIQLFRTTKETRNGWKRYAGGSESVLTGNNWDASMITGLQTVAALLNDTLTAVGGTLEPVIVRRTFTGDPPVLNPVSQWIYNIIQSAAPAGLATTQNTRKKGRGS